jgi:hypothetical protein
MKAPHLGESLLWTLGVHDIHLNRHQIALFRDGAIHITNVQYFHSKGYLKPVGGHPPIAHVASLFRL